MAALRDRVKVLTATVGAGKLALGDAPVGFRNFQNAYASGARVSYVIEDGNNWETGYGTFDRGENSLTREPDASSAGGAAIALSGSGAVSVAFLSRDNVADWPLLVASFSSSSGQGVTGTAFTKVPLTVASIDTHGGFDAAAWEYSVQQSGVYEVVSKLRFQDNIDGGCSYGQGTGTSLADGPHFLWTMTINPGTGQTQRNGLLNQRTMFLSAGQRLFLYTWAQMSDGQRRVTAAEMIVTRTL